MTGRHQKKQMELPFEEEAGGEAKGQPKRDEPVIAKQQTESPTAEEKLMEEICEIENIREAWKRVKGNGGSAGVDGMTVSELLGHLQKHWTEIRGELLSGTYRPKP